MNIEYLQGVRAPVDTAYVSTYCEGVRLVCECVLDVSTTCVVRRATSSVFLVFLLVASSVIGYWTYDSCTTEVRHWAVPNTSTYFGGRGTVRGPAATLCT